jgi:hypothetical protein
VLTESSKGDRARLEEVERGREDRELELAEAQEESKADALRWV